MGDKEAPKKIEVAPEAVAAVYALYDDDSVRTFHINYLKTMATVIKANQERQKAEARSKRPRIINIFLSEGLK